MASLLLQGPCEIDESVIYKQKPGYPFGREYQIQVWFIAIKCRTTRRFVMYPVLWRNFDTLMRIILHHVAYGSTAYTDSWSAYYNNRRKESKLAQFGYVDYTVNHKYQFVSQFSNEIHINTVERTWRSVKNYIRMLRPRLYIDDYV